jgi:predicted amidohydrolase
MDIQLGRPDINLSRAVEGIIQASEINPDVILLPELFTTGFSENLLKVSEPIDGNTVTTLKELAVKYNVNIAGSFAEKWKGQIYNSMPVITPKGIAGIYRKTHLFKPMDEPNTFQPGDEIVAVDLDFGKAGCLICYDIRFPEMARRLTLDGAKVLMVSAEFPHPRLDHWTTLLKARAIENQLFVCAVNRVGRDDTNEFFGHSMIISPWGEVIAEGRVGEEIIFADLELEEVEEARRTIPALEDRREDLY